MISSHIIIKGFSPFLSANSKISESELSLDVSPYSASVGEISVPYSRNKVIVADVVGYGVSDRAVFFDGKPLLECKRDAVKLEFIGEGTGRVFANEYVHAVYLEGDALFSDNLFSLLPGETRDISYTVLQGATDSEITYTAYSLKKNRY